MDQQEDAFSYRGVFRRAAAMPLGGLGTGQLAICGDGSLRHWQLINRIWHDGCVPHSFFAIWACEKGGRGCCARALLSRDIHRLPTEDIPTSTDHLVPEPVKELADALPCVESTVFTGRYPVAELQYLDAALPVEVKLTAYSPFVPLCSADSALPVIFFSFRVRNRVARAVEASLLASLQNFVGWDGISPIHGQSHPGYGGNVNSVVRLADATCVLMTNCRAAEDDPHWGEVILAALAPEALADPAWQALSSLWAQFGLSGKLHSREASEPSAPGQTWNAALAVPIALEPGEEKELTFAYAWRFPNRYAEWDQRYAGIEDTRSRFWVGNAYCRRFPSAMAALVYAKEHFVALKETTFAFVDAFYRGSIPAVILRRAGSQLAIMRSPTCIWAEDGRLLAFEGCHGASTWQKTGGCCPLNCTHVWNYEQSLAHFFPDLERTMREMEFNWQQHASGYIPHRVSYPGYLPRPWERTIGGPANPAVDGMLGAVLKAYREFRISGDMQWLKEVWPACKRLLEYIIREHDVDEDGVIRGEQPNTYDISIYGANTFVGTLYLAALAAGERMSALMGDENFAARCGQLRRKGAANLDAELWNGEYYEQKVDLSQYPTTQWASGCHADQLLGQWWAHELDVGLLLPEEHTVSALESVFRYNFRRQLYGRKQEPRQFAMPDEPGLLICTWPRGGRPAVPTLYSDEVWTGLEYELAALLLWHRLTQQALEVLQAIDTRYNGARRSPWNEIECGNYYARALASWSAFEAACGFVHDASTGLIGLDPKFQPEDFHSFFIANGGWGVLAQRLDGPSQVISLEPKWGAVRLGRLRFRPLLKGRLAAVTCLREQVAPAQLQEHGRGLTEATLPSPTEVREGERFVLVVSCTQEGEER